MIGALIVFTWFFIAVAAPLISPYSPTGLDGTRLESPSLHHWLGTDYLGRDVLSRLFWGTQVVILLAPVSVLLGILIGAPLGLISGYVGGRIDALIMRFIDILLSFPTLLIYILIITSIGASVFNVVIAIALAWGTTIGVGCFIGWRVSASIGVIENTVVVAIGLRR